METLGNKNKRSKNTSVSEQKTTVQKTTVWDFLIHFTNVIYNLLTLKKVSLAFVYAVIIMAMVQCCKTDFTTFIQPAYDVLHYIDEKINNSLYTALVTIIAVISVIGNVTIIKVYRKELERVTKQRKDVIHGIETGELHPLSIHHSSDYKSVYSEMNQLLDDD